MKFLSSLCSYKGCLSSEKANEIIVSYRKNSHSKDQVDTFSFADGGEGTLDALKKLCPERKTAFLLVPSAIKCNRVNAEYGILNDQMVIETSKAIGLNINPFLDFPHSTSYGLGRLILKGIKKGFRKFVITLGGSATADQGAGARYALGYRFYGKDNQEVFPLSGNLSRIEKVDSSSLCPELKECSFTLLSDVRSSLLGETGSTYLYSKQKGAEEKRLPFYEEGRKHFNSILVDCGFKDVSVLPSSGAAGGLGAFFMRRNHYALYSGADYLLTLSNRSERIKDYDYVLLGEGHTDRSTLEGKSIRPRLRLAKKNRIKTVLLSGIIDQEVEDRLREEGVTYFCPLHEKETEEYMETAEEDLIKAFHSFLNQVN